MTQNELRFKAESYAQYESYLFKISGSTMAEVFGRLADLTEKVEALEKAVLDQYKDKTPEPEDKSNA